tara:strand:+ start:1071 stop:1244 length:174 start_codon:yes stop_codon:yes gene_type:complete
MENSRINIDIIGAISFPPGFVNQKEPNNPKMIGIKKNFINLLLMIFDNEKQIKIKTK